MKRAALYARGSTAHQEEQGTIASQVAALRERIVQRLILLLLHSPQAYGLLGFFHVNDQ
jgi:hypothetical protein